MPQSPDGDEQSENETSNGVKNDTAGARIICSESPDSSSPLSKNMYYMFCIFSILISILPTSHIPMGLIMFGITLRLLPHIPINQCSPSDTNECKDNNKNNNNGSATILIAMQHYQFGILYLSIGFHFLLQISMMGGPIHVGNLLFIVWMSDTGALIVGRTTKKRNMNNGNVMAKEEEDGKNSNHHHGGVFVKFLKSVSPGKTLPGLLGAIITGPISALLYPMIVSSPQNPCNTSNDNQCTNMELLPLRLQYFNYHHHNQITQKVLFGLIIALAGIIGDLAESSIKRLLKKKDSGKLLPGHGGVVDRFDSLFVAGIVYYYWLLT